MSTKVMPKFLLDRGGNSVLGRFSSRKPFRRYTQLREPFGWALKFSQSLVLIHATSVTKAFKVTYPLTSSPQEEMLIQHQQKVV